MESIVFHIDVNNAFLSWSAIDLLNHHYPIDIRNTYAVIGGDEKMRKGIVLAKSMPCKKLGIKTADTLYSARKKCPSLKVYPPNFSFYQQMSKKLFELISKYSPDIEVASIDECYLDYGKVKRLYGDEKAFAYKLKEEIKNTLGFTVNIGIAQNKLCAKMASDFQKPDQIHTLYEYEVKEKMYPLPIDQLFGIGRKTAPKLHELGIHTIRDLAEYDEKKLAKIFKNMAKSMIEKAKGMDDTPVCSEEVEQKGIGNEITLEENTTDPKVVEFHLFSLAEMVGIRIRKQNKYAYTVCVTLKNQYFQRKSHQKKLKNATCSSEEIYEKAKEIFYEMYDKDEEIRLIGIRLDHLTSTRTMQYSLFNEFIEKNKNEKLEHVMDELKLKYGTKIIRKASLMETKDPRQIQK